MIGVVVAAVVGVQLLAVACVADAARVSFGSIGAGALVLLMLHCRCIACSVRSLQVNTC